ncbi:MAG TPA: hypothetical protein VFI64_02775 [Nitrososphaeraceae archaeon]|nr:hypothetical protein [Nitrososphaeraceae archaeon]
MKITEDVVGQYIISNEYVKPRIEIGHYYLEWNDKSYGIYQKEMSELKGFLISVIPYFDAIYQMLHSLERPRGKKKYGLDKQLFPDIHVSHNNQGHLIRYDLYMISDGSTFIDRTEKLEVVNEGGESSKKVNVRPKNHVDSGLSLEWKLGQLLFNKQGIIGVKD